VLYQNIASGNPVEKIWIVDYIHYMKSLGYFNVKRHYKTGMILNKVTM
jgi:hypothetical protein